MSLSKPSGGLSALLRSWPSRLAVGGVVAYLGWYFLFGGRSSRDPRYRVPLGQRIKLFFVHKVVDRAMDKLCAPGGPCEMVTTTIGGERFRVFKTAEGNPPDAEAAAAGGKTRPVARRTLLHVFAAAREHASLDFLVYETRRLTYRQVLSQAASLRGRLRGELGVTKGQRVAILMSNKPEWVVAFMGAVMCGAVVVPLNGWWEGAELEYGLRDSGATVLIGDFKRIKRLLPEGRLAALVEQQGLRVVLAKEDGVADEAAQLEAGGSGAVVDLARVAHQADLVLRIEICWCGHTFGN